VKVGTMRQREAQEPGIVEVNPQVLGEGLAGAALLGGEAGKRGPLGTGEQALEPRPEPDALCDVRRRAAGASAGGGGRGTARATIAVALAVTPRRAFGTAFAVIPGAAAAPLLQAVGIARNASVPLCPPNPMEFDNAPVTRTVRA